MNKVKPEDAVEGRKYHLDKHGVGIAVGTSDPDRYLYGFAVRDKDSGQTRMLYPNDDVLPVPEGGGWDWQPPQPIDPGEGWRLLANTELVKEGDEYRRRDDGTHWVPTMNHQSNDGIQTPHCIYRRRIAPTYRPFANAAEFGPHRVRLLKLPTWPSGVSCHVVTAVNDGIYTISVAGETQFHEWTEAMGRFVFVEDGTPFGIKVTP